MKRTCSFVTASKPNAVLEVISIPESRTLFEVIEHLRLQGIHPHLICPLVQPAIYEMPGLANAKYITTHESYRLREEDRILEVTFRCNLEDGDTFFMIELDNGARVLTMTLTELLDHTEKGLVWESHVALNHNPKTGQEEYYLVPEKGWHKRSRRITRYTYQEVR